jgi:hypothetical protein
MARLLDKNLFPQNSIVDGHRLPVNVFERESHGEGRPLARLTLRRNASSVIFDNPPADRESQARSPGLGGEKEVKDAALVLSGDAGSRVADKHLYLLTRFPLSVKPRPHGDGSSGRGRLEGILEQIQNDLFQLILIREDSRQMGIVGLLQVDGTLADFADVQVARCIQELVKVGGLSFQPGWSSEEEKIADQSIEALGFREHRLDQVAMGWGEIHLSLEDLGPRGDAEEGVPDLMSHASHHLSDGRETVFAAQFRLELLDLTQVPEDHDYPLAIVLSVGEIRVVETKGDGAAVRQDEFQLALAGLAPDL